MKFYLLPTAHHIPVASRSPNVPTQISKIWSSSKSLMAYVYFERRLWLLRFWKSETKALLINGWYLGAAFWNYQEVIMWQSFSARKPFHFILFTVVLISSSSLMWSVCGPTLFLPSPEFIGPELPKETFFWIFGLKMFLALLFCDMGMSHKSYFVRFIFFFYW